MKKIVVMLLLVLGLVATPVFAQNKEHKQQKNIESFIPVLKVEVEEFNTAYEEYMDKVVNEIVFQDEMGESIIQEQSNVMLQMAEAYMQLDEYDRLFHAVVHFAGNYQFNEQLVYVPDFLIMTVPVLSAEFSQEQQARYKEFVQQVIADVETYYETHRRFIANEAARILPMKKQPGEMGETLTPWEKLEIQERRNVKRLPKSE